MGDAKGHSLYLYRCFRPSWTLPRPAIAKLIRQSLPSLYILSNKRITITTISMYDWDASAVEDGVLWSEGMRGGNK